MSEPSKEAQGHLMREYIAIMTGQPLPDPEAEAAKLLREIGEGVARKMGMEHRHLGER